MKKTWKRWLGTVAATLVTSTALAQRPDAAGVVTMRGQSPSADEGAVRTSDRSASASGVRQSQYAPADPEVIFENPLEGGGNYADNGGVGFATSQRLSDVQYRLGRNNIDNYGYNGGYTNLNAFVPLTTDGSRNILFFNPRVNITDQGQSGVNLGLGYRFYDETLDRVFGVSSWWDYDDGHNRAYNQWGVSLESLGRFFSTRFNASIPGNDSHDLTAGQTFGSAFFQNNNIAYQYSFLRETSYQNYQLEFASPVPGLANYGAEWAIMGYGLVSQSDGAQDAMGVGGRFELQVTEDLWINTVVSYDRVYGTNTSVNLEMTLPDGMPSRWFQPESVRNKLISSVRRPYRVSTAVNRLNETRLFLDPKDSTPIQVAHIDPSVANGAAAGSILDPFGSVADYMADAGRADFDIIYVGRNLDSTDDTDLNTGIELLNCQRLLGTGTLADGSDHEFQSVDRGDGNTIFTLPGFGGAIAQATGANPLLTNSGAAGTPVVSINGDITEVTGFTIDAGGTANGIESVGSVDGFVVTNNTIQNAQDAINIISDTSPVLGVSSTIPPTRSAGENSGVVSSNTIDGTLGVPAGVNNGIVITHVAGAGAEALNLVVSDNTINSVTGFGIDVQATGGTIAGNAAGFGFLDNVIDQTGQGILARSTGAGTVFDLTVSGNTITDSTDPVNAIFPELGAGMGFLAEAGGAFNFNLVTNNTITGGAGRGAAFVADTGSTMTFAPDVAGDPAFTLNTFSNNTDDGLLFSATGAGSTIDISDLTENTFSNNGASGVDFMAQVAGVINADLLVQNTITGNSEDGISGTADGAGSLIDINIGTPTLPFDATLPVDATLVNTITGNTLNGIDLLALNGATVQGSIRNNIVSDNGLNGIAISAVEPGSLADFNDPANSRDISDNTISGNTAAGVMILADNTGALPGGGAQALLLRNTISGAAGNTQEFGVQVLGLRTGDLNIDIGDTDPLNSNTITGNSDANISVDLAGSSTADVLIQNNAITNAVDGPNVDFAGDGIVFRTTDTARLYNAQVIDNTITGNADDGIRVLANAASQIHATGNPLLPGLLVTGNTISGNQGDGIQIQREGDAIIRSIIGTTGGVGLDPDFGNTITGNSEHGINVLTGGGFTPAGVSTNITVGQNTISGNGTTFGNGVNVETNDDSETSVNLISNVIEGLGTQDNGVAVTTRDASRFGQPGGVNSVFDGNEITGHTLDGVVLTANDVSQLDVDIMGLTQQALIGNNGANGVSIVDTSGGAFGGALIDVNIGDPASSGAGPGADVFPDAPDVIIFQNGNDAIRVAQTGSGDIQLNVDNTLATGNRLNGTPSRHGLSFNADNQVTAGTASIAVDNSTFVDFGDDGMHIFYNHATDPFFTQLNVNVTDSIIGQTQFSTNVGDGVDIEVHDDGAIFNFDNNTIQNNGGDGFRMVLLAEDMTTSRLALFPDRDDNASGQNETTSPNHPGLPGTFWADPNFVDITSRLTLTDNLIRFNGQDGVDLAIGAGTRLGTLGNRTVVRGNTMTGNSDSGFLTRTITNTAVNPPLDSVNQGENLIDFVRLDPMAFLFLSFGDNVQPNTTSQLNPTVTGGVIQPADAVKGSANRDIITRFDVQTNDLNNSTIGGFPVSTLDTFNGGWNTPVTFTNDITGVTFGPQLINTGAVTNTP
ncbi:MAG: hypothetical protein DWH91_11185 [Planctomycetota bacterium]|nr:MAG: hypothetical protein DWH91_11185 [Planctomycetota bacterium]